MKLKELKIVVLTESRSLGHEFDNTNFRWRAAEHGWRNGGRNGGLFNECKICRRRIRVKKSMPGGDYKRPDAFGSALTEKCTGMAG